jgi:hypothetical protein
MNREEIFRMAREAGFDPHDVSDDFTCNLENIERFAALVAAAEREDTVRCLEFHGFEDAIGYLNWRWRNRAGSDV